MSVLCNTKPKPVNNKFPQISVSKVYANNVNFPES